MPWFHHRQSSDLHEPRLYRRKSSGAHVLLTTHDPSIPGPKLRLLCLHGLRGSAAILRANAAPLVPLTRYADLVFVDAPSLQRGERGWYNMATFAGFDETRAYLANVVRTHGPFDGVLGLSQGAVLASLLVGLGFAFDFAVMVGGFPVADAGLRRVYDDEGRYSIPNLHVYGERDEIVPPAASRRLAALFVAPEVVVHGGGHEIPADAASVRKIKEFVRVQHVARFGDGNHVPNGGDK